MNNDFSNLVNLLWKECVNNLNKNLTEEETSKFSNNDYYYLLVIKSLGRPKLSELANELSLTKPAVTAIVRKLEKIALVKKVQSNEDKRVYYLELTNKGNNILNGDQEVYEWVIKNIQDIVKNEDELRLVSGIIKELTKRLMNIIDKEEKI